MVSTCHLMKMSEPKPPRSTQPSKMAACPATARGRRNRSTSSNSGLTKEWRLDSTSFNRLPPLHSHLVQELLLSGLVFPRHRAECDGEPVPCIDRDNRQC